MIFFKVENQGLATARKPPVSLREINLLQFKKTGLSLNLAQIWQFLLSKTFPKNLNGFKFEA